MKEVEVEKRNRPAATIKFDRNEVRRGPCMSRIRPRKRGLENDMLRRAVARYGSERQRRESESEGSGRGTRSTLPPVPRGQTLLSHLVDRVKMSPTWSGVRPHPFLSKSGGGRTPERRAGGERGNSGRTGLALCLGTTFSPKSNELEMLAQPKKSPPARKF